MYFDRSSVSSSELRYFNWLVVMAQLFGVVAVVITAVWMGHYRGGFAWQSDPDHEFNYHPLFMIIGMVFLYADGKGRLLDLCFYFSFHTQTSYLQKFKFKTLSTVFMLPKFLKVVQCTSLGSVIFCYEIEVICGNVWLKSWYLPIHIILLILIWFGVP